MKNCLFQLKIDLKHLVFYSNFQVKKIDFNTDLVKSWPIYQLKEARNCTGDIFVFALNSLLKEGKCSKPIW